MAEHCLTRKEIRGLRGDTWITMNKGSTSCNLENFLHDQESQTNNNE